MFIFACVLGGCGGKPPLNPDLALFNGVIWTVDPNQPRAEALAIKGDRIVAVGSNKQIKKMFDGETRVIDLKGAFVMPGFNDAHLHFAEGGFSLLGINLRRARDEDDFTRIIGEYARGLPQGAWITGGNWDHEAWPSHRLPTKEIVDAVCPHHPVFVDRLDGHVALANSLAMGLARVTGDTPDPPGGEIVRDPETGEPTGLFKDEAKGLINRVITPPSEDERMEAIRAALREAARFGVTSIQDNASAEDLHCYQKLHQSGDLSVRINAWTHIDRWDGMGTLGLEQDFGDDWLRLGTVKLFADGSMGAGTALFWEPYQDDPATCGIAIYPYSKLEELILKLDKAGFQVACHAIGDKANHWVLNAFEKALQVNKKRIRRHRIEHAQVVDRGDLSRFKELGVVASIQPSHCIDDMRWAEKRIGKDRCRQAYPFRSLLDAGARVAFGTDWPVETLNPMIGLYAAVTREFTQGGPPGGWFPGEKISMVKAIECYTLGSAFAEFREDVKGSIGAGKLADLVVLSKNLLTISPPEILKIEILYTIVGGKVVYERP